MIRPLLYLSRKAVRDRYPSSIAVLGDFLTILGGLVVYYYTSKAFAPIARSDLQSQVGDYFSYLVIGEVVLFLPMTLFQGLIPFLRASAADGTLEALLVLPVRPQTVALFIEGASLWREGARMAVVLCVAAVFGFHPPAAWYAALVLLQILAIPAFLGAGLLSAALFIRFGRGESALTLVGTAAAILAGAYFPPDVFPEGIRTLSHVGSPFSVLLEATRWFAVTSPPGVPWGSVVTLLLWGLGLLPAGYLLLGAAFNWVRRSGTPLLFTS